MLVTENRARHVTYHWSWEPARRRTLLSRSSPRFVVSWEGPEIVSAVAHYKGKPFALCIYEGSGGPPKDDSYIVGEVSGVGHYIVPWWYSGGHAPGLACMSPMSDVIMTGQFTPAEAFWMSDFYYLPDRGPGVSTIRSLTQDMNLVGLYHWHFGSVY